jgi:hypothetical protein
MRNIWHGFETETMSSGFLTAAAGQLRLAVLWLSPRRPLLQTLFFAKEIWNYRFTAFSALGFALGEGSGRPSESCLETPAFLYGIVILSVVHVISHL